MPSTYCTPSDVAAFMTANQFPFDSNSPYSSTLVETYINMAEDEIDAIMKRTWREKTSTAEEQTISWNTVTSFYVTNHYGNIKTRYGPIRTISSLEIIRGNSYSDITAEEGRTAAWFADKARRIIYLRRVAWPVYQPINVRITYTYGEASADMPAFIKMAAMLRTAWYILQSDDYSVLMPEGTDVIRNSEKAMEWDQKFKELTVPHRRGLIWK